MSANDTSVHLLTQKEIAATVRSMRRHMAWSQKTLAGIAGLTVFAVQNLEGSQLSNRSDRRAIAGAFGWSLSFFDEPRDIPTDEELKIQKALFHSEYFFLDTTPLDSRGIVACLKSAEGHIAMMPSSLAELPIVAQAAFDAIARYVHDHLDMICDGHWTKAKQHVDALAALEKPLLNVGHRLHAAVRQTMVRNPAWIDPTPISLTVLYIIAAPDKHELAQVAVKRQLTM